MSNPSDDLIGTYRGRPIFILPTYDTPYYWTPANGKGERNVFGSVNHTSSYATLRRRIDKANARKAISHR